MRSIDTKSKNPSSAKVCEESKIVMTTPNNTLNDDDEADFNDGDISEKTQDLNKSPSIASKGVKENASFVP